jgi:hypothetical protein
MSILKLLTKDLDWRETEIASMRLLLTSGSVSPTQRSALLRAAWAMLYAHYEGFCKIALTAFFDAISKAGVKNYQLPKPTRVTALRGSFKKMRNMVDDELLVELEGFSSNHLNKVAAFPEVDTRSNLWPDVLIELLRLADLSSAKVEENQAKLSTLVSRRNGIAHGEDNIIAEFEYYRTYEDAVYAVLYDLAYQVETRLGSAPYGSPSNQPHVV